MGRLGSAHSFVYHPSSLLSGLVGTHAPQSRPTRPQRSARATSEMRKANHPFFAHERLTRRAKLAGVIAFSFLCHGHHGVSNFGRLFLKKIIHDNDDNVLFLVYWRVVACRLIKSRRKRMWPANVSLFVAQLAHNVVFACVMSCYVVVISSGGGYK